MHRWLLAVGMLIPAWSNASDEAPAPPGIAPARLPPALTPREDKPGVATSPCTEASRKAVQTAVPWLRTLPAPLIKPPNADASENARAIRLSPAGREIEAPVTSFNRPVPPPLPIK